MSELPPVVTSYRPLHVDLFCCAGGASTGYHRAGFDVVGVDLDPQPDYPFQFVQADALEFLAEHGRAFTSGSGSPPCQDSSALTKGNRKRPGWSDTHVDLIGATRDAFDATGMPYVLENVQGSRLRRDLTLCGLMFGLKVFRHRYFELGCWPWIQGGPVHPSHQGHRVAGWRHGVRHEGDMVAVYGDGGGKGSVADWQAAMGIDWTSSKHHLREAIPPAYTEWIGHHLLEVVQQRAGELSGFPHVDPLTA